MERFGGLCTDLSSGRLSYGPAGCSVDWSAAVSKNGYGPGPRRSVKIITNLFLHESFSETITSTVKSHISMLYFYFSKIISFCVRKNGGKRVKLEERALYFS